MKENLDPKSLVDYCVNSELMHKCIFMQVYEEFLTFSYWLKGFQPNNILEIGTMGSTFWIMNKLSSGKKVSIDIENRESIIHHFMWEEDWMFVVGSSQDVNNFDKIRNKCDKYDLIFIDGDHSYDGVRNDILSWFPKIKIGGFICGHDFDPDLEMPEGNIFGVNKAVTEIFKDKIDKLCLTNESHFKSWFIQK